jgi:hypothetical protein
MNAYYLLILIGGYNNLYNAFTPSYISLEGVFTGIKNVIPNVSSRVTAYKTLEVIFDTSIPKVP